MQSKARATPATLILLPAREKVPKADEGAGTRWEQCCFPTSVYFSGSTFNVCSSNKGMS